MLLNVNMANKFLYITYSIVFIQLLLRNFGKFSKCFFLLNIYF